jgi:hypothetical protein
MCKNGCYVRARLFFSGEKRGSIPDGRKKIQTPATPDQRVRAARRAIRFQQLCRPTAARAKQSIIMMYSCLSQGVCLCGSMYRCVYQSQYVNPLSTLKHLHRIRVYLLFLIPPLSSLKDGVALIIRYPQATTRSSGLAPAPSGPHL